MDDISKSVNSTLSNLEGAYAPNTLRAYYADAKSFVDWCEQINIAPFPLTSETVKSFIERMQIDYSYSTIRRRLSALRRLNGLLGFEDQTFTEDVYLTIRKLKRAKSTEQRQSLAWPQSRRLSMLPMYRQSSSPSAILDSPRVILRVTKVSPRRGDSWLNRIPLHAYIP